MTDKIRLVLTCPACPEQYDAFLGDAKVGYLRLRHGHFYVRCPDIEGDKVYEANPNGDGEFEDDERDYHLRWAVFCIQGWLENDQRHKSPAPDVQYEIVGNPGGAFDRIRKALSEN